MVGDFRIEEWLVQPQLNTVVRPDNGSVKLEPKVMEVLVYLADHVGEVVSRAVRDPSSDTGWKIEIGPFPGWEDVPAW